MEAGFLDHLFATPAAEAGVVELRPAPGRRVAGGPAVEPMIEEAEAGPPARPATTAAAPDDPVAERVEVPRDAGPAPVHEPAPTLNAVPARPTASQPEQREAPEPVRATPPRSEPRGREEPAMQGPPPPLVSSDAVLQPAPWPAPSVHRPPGPIDPGPSREIVVERETRVEATAPAPERVAFVPVPAQPALPTPVATQPAVSEPAPILQPSQLQVVGGPPQVTVVAAETAQPPAPARPVVESQPAPPAQAPAEVAEPAAALPVPVAAQPAVARPVERRAAAEPKPQRLANAEPQAVTVRIGRIEIVARSPKPQPAVRRATRAARSHQIDPQLPLGRGGR